MNVSLEQLEKLQDINKIEKITEHLTEVFNILGVDLNNPSTVNTPKRIAKMWFNETCQHLNNKNVKELTEKMTCFPIENGDVVQPITVETEFTSWCEHHFMPFFGKIRVTYLPNEWIIGLSKIPRIVEYFSQKPQVQERLGKEIADYLRYITNAQYVTVEIYDTTHTCVTCRGVRSNAITNTSYTSMQ